MRIDVDGQQRVQQRPQLIRDAEPRRGAIIWGPLSFSLLGFLSLHTSYFTPFSGYSDRHLDFAYVSMKDYPYISPGTLTSAMNSGLYARPFDMALGTMLM